MNIDMWPYIEEFIRNHNLVDLTNIVALPLVSYFANAGAKDKKIKEASIRTAWFGVFYTIFMMTINILFNIDKYVNAFISGGIFVFWFGFQYFSFCKKKRKQN